ncbi:glycosyltransferase [Chloroflexota bacterium]
MTSKPPMEKLDNDIHVAYLTTFPPRQCGIATFTQDLVNAIDEMYLPNIQSGIIAMNNPDIKVHGYPKKVFLQINQDNRQEYIDIARQINRNPEIHLVNIQHEFGIYGGNMGSYLIPFLETLEKPSVITCHTVLPDPDDELLHIVRSIADNSSALIVMTELSHHILTQDYGIPHIKIRIIPHGIHPTPFTSSHQAKKSLGFARKIVLSTFGMLSRGKGLEYVIDALPDVIKEYPDFVYIIVGATHPLVVEREGESYRDSLLKKISELNLYDHVKLYNEYYPTGELLHFLKATDIYISTSLDPNQAVSGTLSYALGTGRPVISTAFAQAKEIVTDEVGTIVDIRDSRAYTDAILKLLHDKDLRSQLGHNAYFRTRNMIWQNVALHYGLVFSEHAKELAETSRQKSLPSIKIDHIARLTNNYGMVQFAGLSKPDISSGYTLDDNARALAAITLHYKALGKSQNQPGRINYKRKLAKLINTYLDFIASTRNEEGHFVNYMNGDRTLNDEMNNHHNPEDSEARAVCALALVSTTSALPKRARDKANALLNSRTNKGLSFNSPRAIASHIKMLYSLLSNKTTKDRDALKAELKKQCDILVQHYEATNTPDWQWFERSLNYNNGVLPKALLLGYQITKDKRYLQVGKSTLDFLIKKSFVDGILMPIGQEGWYRKGRKRYHFDQQPEEVTALINALNTCYFVTKDKYYSDLMHQAFFWFLGDNSLKQVVYDRTTGGCYDGIGRETINLNQGAESTISYLMARLAFE